MKHCAFSSLLLTFGLVWGEARFFVHAVEEKGNNNIIFLSRRDELNFFVVKPRVSGGRTTKNKKTAVTRGIYS